MELNRKIDYSFDEQLENIFKKLGIKLNVDRMDDAEMSICGEVLSPFIEWVLHPDYIQYVPKIKSTGELILD